MKNKYLSLLIILIPMILIAQDFKQKSLAVTIYNTNLGVVKDLREANLEKGTKSLKLTDVASQIDPTSVHINFDGIVLEQNYQYDLVSMDKILGKYIDKDIQLINESGELLEGKLLSSYSGQIVLEKKTGGLMMLPATKDYRISVGELPEGLITKPTLVWTLNANKSGSQDVEVSYMTRGMNWKAEYVAVLNEDDTKLDLNSWVSIDNNSGKTYKEAQIKLVAGDVNMANQRRQSREVYTMSATEKSTDQFAEQEFFEYHMYTLQRPATIANNENKQISLFEAENISAEKIYSVEARGNGKQKVKVKIIFKNSKEENLGIPIPKGRVRVYKSDGESLQFIGEDMIDHTPRNEGIKLTIGNAFDILADVTLKERTRITQKIDEQKFEITLTNRKKSDIVVNVRKWLGYDWEIISPSHSWERNESQSADFEVPVKADDKTIITFTVRYIHP